MPELNLTEEYRRKFNGTYVMSEKEGPIYISRIEAVTDYPELVASFEIKRSLRALYVESPDPVDILTNSTQLGVIWRNPVERGFRAYKRPGSKILLYYICRRPERQWKVGACDGNTTITNVVTWGKDSLGGLGAGVLTPPVYLNSLEKATEGPAGLISPNFAVRSGILYYKIYPIARVENNAQAKVLDQKFLVFRELFQEEAHATLVH